MSRVLTGQPSPAQQRVPGTMTAPPARRNHQAQSSHG